MLKNHHVFFIIFPFSTGKTARYLAFTSFGCRSHGIFRATIREFISINRRDIKIIKNPMNMSCFWVFFSIFPWFSCVFQHFPMVFLCFSAFSHGFPMVFPWFSHGISQGFNCGVIARVRGGVPGRGRLQNRHLGPAAAGAGRFTEPKLGDNLDKNMENWVS
jgi:hypothetical protein